MVGPVQDNVDEIKEMPNILMLGTKSFADLPYYIDAFDVCIIPYKHSGFTRTVYPTKLNE